MLSLPLVSLALLTTLAPPPAACDSAALRTPVATVVDTLRLVARGGSGMGVLPHPWIDFVLDAVATRLRIAQPLDMPVFDGAGTVMGRRESFTRPVLRDEVRVTMRRDGHVTDVDLVTRSLADAADAALLAAVHAADSADALVPTPEEVPERATVFVSLTTREPPDTTKPPIDRATRDVALLTLPLFRDATWVLPRPGNPGPRYPQAEKAAGVEGAVHLEFVIDEHGRLVPSTLRVLRYTSEPFVRSVYDALQRMEFLPATVAGCPVKQLVRQPFTFELRP